tara:strand:+ start:167 stop:487 length:321 start_codon:yes stop_codon:yes gene_type:complete
MSKISKHYLAEVLEIMLQLNCRCDLLTEEIDFFPRQWANLSLTNKACHHQVGKLTTSGEMEIPRIPKNCDGCLFSQVVTIKYIRWKRVLSKSRQGPIPNSVVIKEH